MTSNPYKKLTGERKIQLMTLRPGEVSDPITSELTPVNLDMSLKYDARSYEWKKDKGLTNITCGSTSLSVTHNLAAAIRALRHPASPKVLWIDAICINQEDPKEKSKQIPLMRDIYATAKSVLVWLGPSFRGVAAAFEVLPRNGRG